jgi:hypothetical protein
LVKGEFNLHKEEKMGSEVIIAHLVAMTWELGFDMSFTPQPYTLESSLDWKKLLIGQGWKRVWRIFGWSVRLVK